MNNPFRMLQRLLPMLAITAFLPAWSFSLANVDQSSSPVFTYPVSDSFHCAVSSVPREFPLIEGRWTAPPTWNYSASVRGAVPDGPILGNGDMGVVVGAQLSGLNSSVDSQITFFIGLNQFWLINNTEQCYLHWPQIPDPYLSQIMTVGRLTIAIPAAVELVYFRATQSIGTGVVTVQLLDKDESVYLSLSSFVSATAGNVLVTNLTIYPKAPQDPSEPSLYLTSSTLSPPQQAAAVYPSVESSAGCTSSQAQSIPCIQATGLVEGDYITRSLNYNQSHVFPIHGALVTRILDPGKDSYRLLSAASDGSFETRSVLFLRAGQPISIVSQVLTNTDLSGIDQNSYSPPVPPSFSLLPLPPLQKLLLSYTADTIRSLLQAHLSWWTDSYTRCGSTVSFPDAEDDTLQRFWWGAAYLVSSSMRLGSVSPGLWGPFIYNDHMGWHGDYTTDYNHQAQVWSLYSSNRLADAASSYPPIFQYVPQAIFNGLYQKNPVLSTFYPAHISPWGFSSSLGPAGSLGQTWLGSYLALNLISHYEFSRDWAYLRTVLYPFLKLQMNWWMFYLQKETLPAGGYRWINPQDCTCEDCSCGQGGKSSALNGILPICMIRRTMAMSAHYATLLDVNLPERQSWFDVVHNLAQYPIGNVGSSERPLIVFSYGEDRNQSEPKSLPTQGEWPGNINPIWPCETIGMHSAGDLVTISINSLVWSGFDQGNSFPIHFPAAARVGFPVETLLQQYNAILRRMFNNLWYFEHGGGIETIGGVEGINSCLLQSNEYAIALFPVWPHNHSARFVDLRARGGFLLSASYSAVPQTIANVSLFSTVGGRVALFHPWQQSLQEKQSILQQRYEDARTRGFIAFLSADGAYLFPNGRYEWDQLTPAEQAVYLLRPAPVDVLVQEEGRSESVPLTWYGSAPSIIGYVDMLATSPQHWFEFDTLPNRTYQILHFTEPDSWSQVSIRS